MRERNIGWRLDYVLASEPLARKAGSCDAVREFGTSDHAPVTAIFDLPLDRTALPEETPPPPPGQIPLF